MTDALTPEMSAAIERLERVAGSMDRLGETERASDIRLVLAARTEASASLKEDFSALPPIAPEESVLLVADALKEHLASNAYDGDAIDFMGLADTALKACGQAALHRSEALVPLSAKMARAQADLYADMKAQRDGLLEDAERWRALMTIPRINMQGSAGIDAITGQRTQGEFVHFGAEFWTEFDGSAYPDLIDGINRSTEWGRHALVGTADALRAKQARDACTATTPPSSPSPSAPYSTLLAAVVQAESLTRNTNYFSAESLRTQVAEVGRVLRNAIALGAGGTGSEG